MTEIDLVNELREAAVYLGDNWGGALLLIGWFELRVRPWLRNAVATVYAIARHLQVDPVTPNTATATKDPTP